MTLREYTEFTEWAGRSIIHPNKAFIPVHIASILSRLNLQPNHWLSQIERYGNNYCSVVGPIDLIREKAV